MSTSDSSLPHSPSKQALLDRISDQFDVVVESHIFGEIELEICRVNNPDSMLDEHAIIAGHDEFSWQPYWAQAWDAAIAMAHILADQDFSGRRILDLGCGLGITGAVVAARGGSVVLGDYAPPALDFAKVNCWPWRDRATVRKIDWKQDRLDERFDLIIAADILYDRSDIAALDRFWRDHLAPAGKILHGDPNRALTVEFFEKFKKLGWGIKFEVNSIPESTKRLRLATFSLES